MNRIIGHAFQLWHPTPHKRAGRVVIQALIGWVVDANDTSNARIRRGPA